MEEDKKNEEIQTLDEAHDNNWDIEAEQERHNLDEAHDVADKKNQEIHPQDRFSRFMFGTRRGNVQPISRNVQSNRDVQGQYQPSIDYDALMGHLDVLVDSAQKLKPLFQKAFPFIEQVWKKK